MQPSALSFVVITCCCSRAVLSESVVGWLLAVGLLVAGLYGVACCWLPSGWAFLVFSRSHSGGEGGGGVSSAAVALAGGWRLSVQILFSKRLKSTSHPIAHSLSILSPSTTTVRLYICTRETRHPTNDFATSVIVPFHPSKFHQLRAFYSFWELATTPNIKHPHSSPRGV